MRSPLEVGFAAVEGGLLVAVVVTAGEEGVLQVEGEERAFGSTFSAKRVHMENKSILKISHVKLQQLSHLYTSEFANLILILIFNYQLLNYQ